MTSAAVAAQAAPQPASEEASSEITITHQVPRQAIADRCPVEETRAAETAVAQREAASESAIQ